jgi:hypothetical protein
MLEEPSILPYTSAVFHCLGKPIVLHTSTWTDPVFRVAVTVSPCRSPFVLLVSTQYPLPRLAPPFLRLGFCALRRCLMPRLIPFTPLFLLRASCLSVSLMILACLAFFCSSLMMFPALLSPSVFFCRRLRAVPRAASGLSL